MQFYVQNEMDYKSPLCTKLSNEHQMKIHKIIKILFVKC